MSPSKLTLRDNSVTIVCLFSLPGRVRNFSQGEGAIGVVVGVVPEAAQFNNIPVDWLQIQVKDSHDGLNYSSRIF
jgi:hypothetical protein